MTAPAADDEMPDLKPCPFCGGPAKISEPSSTIYGRYFYEVGCPTCPDASFYDREEWSDGLLVLPEKECVTRWNTRTAGDVDCETCHNTRRIDCGPDDGTFAHPCDDCRPEELKEFQRGIIYAEASAGDVSQLVEALRRIGSVSDIALVNDRDKSLLENTLVAIRDEAKAALAKFAGGGK